MGAALLLTSGCLGWAQKGYDAGEAGYNPTEKTLTAATVAGLQEVWHKPGAVLGLVSSGNRVHAVRYGDLGGEATTYRADAGAQVWASRLERYVTRPYVAVLRGHAGDHDGCSAGGLGHGVPPPYLLGAAFDVATGESRTHPFLAYAYPRGTCRAPARDASPCGEQRRYDDRLRLRRRGV